MLIIMRSVCDYVKDVTRSQYKNQYPIKGETQWNIGMELEQQTTHTQPSCTTQTGRHCLKKMTARDRLISVIALGQELLKMTLWAWYKWDAHVHRHILSGTHGDEGNLLCGAIAPLLDVLTIIDENMKK